MVVGGFFARVIADLLSADGMRSVRPSRAELDVEGARSVREYLRRGDILVDAAGPFQTRTTTLLESAMDAGAHVIDINESLGYARRVHALGGRVAAADISVRTACSAVSTVAVFLVRRSAVGAPVRVSALVAPASRETAHAATLRALLASVGAPIEVWRDGAFASARGWRESRWFASPGRRAHLVESALALDLPPLYPSLRRVDTWTDASTPGANALLALVSRLPAARGAATAALPLGALLARTLGTRRGGFGIEVEDASGAVDRLWLGSSQGSYRIAALPAALAARELVEGRARERGIVPASRHVSEERLVEGLRRNGITAAR